ncbi:hypothetical protein [Microscilla marina]|uniref:Uncharacterized protein n=1 Tax=Microscilla marina ATCC 23134 TaxID=313606 RepID=A1ZIC8_MICM2|nr:hypothetical protein [Microscilla marina]EAY29796.1 hypothetical protein M23134_05668 [Microscilla marina ATCC 23134]
MKQLTNSPLHARATNYAMHKITEGSRETRIVGELIALENIRKTTANEIVQHAKTLLAAPEEPPELLSLYEWIQDWLENGQSHHQIIEQLRAKGVEKTQAEEILQQAIYFQDSKNEQVNKVKNIAAHSSQIHRQVQIWRKQLMSPHTIQQKLQKKYNLNAQEAQSIFFSAALHNKAQQQVEIQVSDHCPQNNQTKCLLMLSFIILCALGCHWFLEGVTGQVLTTVFSLAVVALITYRFTRRHYRQSSYIE